MKSHGVSIVEQSCVSTGYPEKGFVPKLPQIAGLFSSHRKWANVTKKT
jgi:hypothetical protein